MLKRRWAIPLLIASLLSLSTLPAASASPLEPPRPADAGAESSVPLPEIAAHTTQVASGLKRPTALVAPDDGTGRLFITEKNGTVRAYHPDTGLAAAPVLDLVRRGRVGQRARAARHHARPNFAASRDLYVAYTSLPDGALTLARYRSTSPAWRCCSPRSTPSTATTTAARSRSAATATSTGAPATAAAPRTPSTPGSASTPCSARSCAST